MQVRLGNMQHPSLCEKLVSPEENRGPRRRKKVVAVKGCVCVWGGGGFPFLLSVKA